MNITTKYNIGDEVLWIKDKTIFISKIIAINTNTQEFYEEKPRITYEIKHQNMGNFFTNSLYESELFPDKQSLLASL